MAISFSDLGGSGGGKFQKTEIITSTQSWTVPSDVTEIEVILCGGGGGGGRANLNFRGGAGGGGSANWGIFSVTPSSSHTITIGAGGVAANLGQNGGTGATSSLGSLFTVVGGGGGGLYGLKGIPGGKGGGGGFGLWEFASRQVPDDGVNGVYGFGGGGGGANCQDYQSRPSCGVDGGGHGADSIQSPKPATSGLTNTGGGGGGGNSGQPAAAGGSGVCIIKYWTAG